MTQKKLFDNGDNVMKILVGLLVFLIIDCWSFYHTEIYSISVIHYISLSLCFFSIIFLLGNFKKLEVMPMIKIPGIYIISAFLLAINLVSFAEFYYQTGLLSHNVITRDRGTLLYYSIGNFLNRSESLEVPAQIRKYALIQTFTGYVSLAYLISRFIEMSLHKAKQGSDNLTT